jgi:NADH-quinone oxidoreductase subunit L
MGVLAVLAVVAGWMGGDLEILLHHSVSLHAASDEAGHPPVLVPVLGTLAALGGILLAWLGYQRRRFSPSAVYEAVRPVSRLLERRYYVDDVFEGGYRVLYLGATRVVGWFDRFVVDGIVNGITELTLVVATGLRRVQTGRVQDALYAVVIGLLLLVFLALRP